GGGGPRRGRVSAAAREGGAPRLGGCLGGPGRLGVSVSGGGSPAPSPPCGWPPMGARATLPCHGCGGVRLPPAGGADRAGAGGAAGFITAAGARSRHRGRRGSSVLRAARAAAGG